MRADPAQVNRESPVESAIEIGTVPTDGNLDNIGSRYLRAAVYSGFVGGASQLLNGLTLVILARHLGLRNFGVYSLVTSLIGIVVGLSSMGQNSILAKMLPQYYVSNRKLGGAIFADVLILTSAGLILFCLILFLLSNWIAVRVYDDVSLTGVFRLSAFLTLTVSLFYLTSSAVAGLQDFKVYSGAMLVRSILFLVLAAGARISGLSGALVGQLLATLLTLLLLLAIVVKLGRARFPGDIKPVFSAEILSIVAKFALPTWLLILLSLPAYWWLNTLLARDTGFAQVGLFGVAYSFAQLIMIFPGSLYVPAMTFMAEAHALSEPQMFRRLLSSNVHGMWALTLPLALACAVLSPLLVGALFGAAYSAAAPLVSVMSFTALVMVIIGLINTALVASGRLWQAFGIGLAWAVLFFVLGLVCIPRWGAMGAAAVLGVSHVFYFIGLFVYSRFALGVVYSGLGRLVIVTIPAFSLAVAIIVSFRGVALYSMAALLLSSMIAVEWFWVCDGPEKALLWRLGGKLQMSRRRIGLCLS